MEPEPIHAHKHSQHSRTLEQRGEATFEKSAKLKKASQQAIRSSHDIIQDAKNLMDQSRRLKKH